MGFELLVSTKRDPVQTTTFDGPPSRRASYAAIAVNGNFDGAAAQGVLRLVADLAAESTDSIVIEMQDVVADDTAVTATFAAALMEQRAAGIQVQVAASQHALHAKLARLNDARDWLLAFSEGNAPAPCARRAIHLDGVYEAG